VASTLSLNRPPPPVPTSYESPPRMPRKMWISKIAASACVGITAKLMTSCRNHFLPRPMALTNYRSYLDTSFIGSRIVSACIMPTRSAPARPVNFSQSTPLLALSNLPEWSLGK
jgi:hypothetical protein